MKKFTLIAILFTLALSSQAQSIVQTSATGGQMVAYTSATYTVLDSSSVRVRKEYSYTSTFATSYPGAWDTTVNNTAVTDTVTTNDSITFQTSRSYFVRWTLETLDSAHTILHSNVRRVDVARIKVKPTISLGVNSATTDGGIQAYTFHAGFDSARIDIWISDGDRNYAFPLGSPVYSFIVTDSGTISFTFTGVIANHDFSYKFQITNSKGDTITGIKWIHTLSSGAAWVAQADSSVTDTSNVFVWIPTGTNNNNITIQTYIAFHGSTTPLQTVTTNLVGQNTSTRTMVAFHNMPTNTFYDVWSCITSGGSGCAQSILVHTNVVPVTFALTTDSFTWNAVTGDVYVHGTAVIPSGQTADVYAEGSTSNTFAVVDLYSTTTNYAQGIQHVIQHISGVPLNTVRFYHLKGYTVPAGDQATGNNRPFTLTMPADNILPVVTNFDTLYVAGAGTVFTTELTWNGSDNVGIVKYFIRVNGQIVDSLLVGTTNYILDGLHADSIYLIELQAKDAAGNYSLPQTILIHVPAPVVIVQAYISSATSRVCVNIDSAWGEIVDVYGTGFNPNSYYIGHYAYNGYEDTSYVTYISATHCKVWIWYKYTDTVTYTIYNDGVPASNSSRTIIGECLTGLKDVSTFSSKAYPNPFTGTLTVTASQSGLSYRVIDLTGKDVSAGSLEDTNELQLQELESGMYLLQVYDKQNPDNSYTTKIVKQ